VPGAVFGLSYTHGGGDEEEDDGDGEVSQKTVVVTGPGGSAWTADEGDTWNSLAGVTDYWAVAFASPRSGWLVGTNGRILKISF
jgi:photosystem II stability/assembly factor-like uncharacterized protein